MVSWDLAEAQAEALASPYSAVRDKAEKTGNLMAIATARLGRFGKESSSIPRHVMPRVFFQKRV